jgi:putative tricarboxylic transport membrane protein
MKATHAALGAGVLALGVIYALGSRGISSDAGYGGVGPNFLPLVVGIALLACGAWLLVETFTGGFRQLDEPSGAEYGDWAAFAWVSLAILLDALLIERIGFILACTVCFLVAVRGLRWSQGVRDASPLTWLRDAAIGFAISAPVYWMFTKLLAINLPGLTQTGWI